MNDLSKLKFKVTFDLLGFLFKEKKYVCGYEISDEVMCNDMTTITKKATMLYGKEWIHSSLIEKDKAIPLTEFIKKLKKEVKRMERIKR